MEFTPDELVVLKQIFRRWELTNGRTALEEIEHLETAPYVVGFKPADDEIRLHRPDWIEFVNKLKRIAKSQPED